MFSTGTMQHEVMHTHTHTYMYSCSHYTITASFLVIGNCFTPGTWPYVSSPTINFRLTKLTRQNAEYLPRNIICALY